MGDQVVTSQAAVLLEELVSKCRANGLSFDLNYVHANDSLEWSVYGEGKGEHNGGWERSLEYGLSCAIEFVDSLR